MEKFNDFQRSGFTLAAACGLIGITYGGGNAAAAVSSALLVSARNALYGPIITKSLRKGRSYKAAAAHFVIDETIAVASSQESVKDTRDSFWFTGISLFIFWNLGTILGVLLVGILEYPGSWGLDAAFPAAFVALILPHVSTREGKITAVVAGLVTTVSIPLTPVGMPILLASTAILPGLVALKKKKKRTI